MHLKFSITSGIPLRHSKLSLLRGSALLGRTRGGDRGMKGSKEAKEIKQGSIEEIVGAKSRKGRREGQTE